MKTIMMDVKSRHNIIEWGQWIVIVMLAFSAMVGWGMRAYDAMRPQTWTIEDRPPPLAAVVQVDEQGHVVTWSRGMEVLTGFNEKEMIGSSPVILMTDDYAKKHNESMSNRFAYCKRRLQSGMPTAGIIRRVRCKILNKDQRSLEVEIAVSMVLSDGVPLARAEFWEVVP